MELLVVVFMLSSAVAYNNEEPPGRPKPPGPPNVTLYAKSSTSIKVLWSQSPNLHKYCTVLTYSVDLIQTDTQVNVVHLILLAMDSPKTIKKLKPYTNYTVYVRAHAVLCGSSEQSEPKTVTTFEEAPSKAPLIRLASTTPNTILVSWDPLPLKDRNGVIIVYQIYYMKVGDTIIMMDKAPGTATSFLIKDLLPDTVYQVRVLAATKAGYCRIDQKDWPWVDYRTPSRGDFNWALSNKPVIYGDNIILTCKTERVLTDRGDACRVRQWYSGQKRLLYNGTSVDATKYEERTNVSSMEFSLVIKNYTESDLNINYTCSCGFKSYTKRLGLNDNNFIVPPLRVETHIRQSNEMLSIYLHIERVYPCPECSIVIGERTVIDNLTFTSVVKHGIFYNATDEASINIIDNDCGKKPTVLCYIGNKYNIVNTSGELIQNCTDGGSTNGDSLKNTWVVTLSVVVLVICLLIGGVIVYKRRSIQKRMITKITKTDDTIDYDVDQEHIVLDMKSKADKENDSGVIMYDENYSLIT